MIRAGWTTLATGGFIGRVSGWDAGNWEPLGEPLADGLQRVFAFAFSRDGSCSPPLDTMEA